MNMHAIVLAGGYATRLWPITKDRPKMFLPMGDTTVIDQIFEDLENDDRVEDVYVSTNEAFADEFRTYLADSQYEKPQLSVEDTTQEDEKFGVVGALAQLIDREALTDDTLVIAGDNYMSFDVSEFVDEFQEGRHPTVAAYDVGSPENATEYGVIETEDGYIVDFEEKPDTPASSLISIACYGFPADTLELFDVYLDGDNNPDEPGWFLQWLQAREQVRAFTFDGAWFDIGTAGSYLDAAAYELDGDTSICPTAHVENSEIGDNVQIMDGATVVDSELERAVVFPETTIRGSSIKNSLIDEECTIEGVDLNGSIVGSYTDLR